MKVFTSYVSNGLYPQLDTFYTALVEEWYSLNKPYASELSIVTNVPSQFSAIPIDIVSLSDNESYNVRTRRLAYMKQYDYMMSTQSLCWRRFISLHTEPVLYLDPDAVLLVAANTILSKSKFTDFAFYKKPLIDYYDVGTAILTSTDNTIKWLDEIDAIQLKRGTYFIEPHIASNIVRYTNNVLNANILLRGVGLIKPYDIIHGMFSLDMLDACIAPKYQKFCELLRMKREMHGR